MAENEEVLTISAGEEDPGFSSTSFAVEDIEEVYITAADSKISVDEVIFVTFAAVVFVTVVAFVTAVVIVTAVVFITAVVFELIAEEVASFDIMELFEED